MQAFVTTVLGQVSANDLGVTLCHEHLFIDLWTEFGRDGLLNDIDLSVIELKPYIASGGRTVVDCSNSDIGRDPVGLREVAKRTGLNIIMGTGHYRQPYLDNAWFDRNDPDAIANQLTAELTHGVGQTDIRAGIIGEIGSERSWISAAEERSFRGAARAHLATGVTITTHAAGWPVGLKQLDILESEGVSPKHVIIGHCDTVPNRQYHQELAARGSYVEFDTVRTDNDYEVAMRVDSIRALAESGHLDQVLLSQDICLRQHLASFGGAGYAFILLKFIPRLLSAGFSDADIHKMLVDNPSRALTGSDNLNKGCAHD